MQKEEKVVVVLLVMILLSLCILYIVLPRPEGIMDRAMLFSSKSNVGEEVYVEGVVFDKQVTEGDHLILLIGPEKTKVFISHEAGAVEIAKMMEKGDLVRIYGIVTEYKGEIEIDVKSGTHVVPKVL
ncbi:nucleotide-binding protein [Halobacteriota archaeon]